MGTEVTLDINGNMIDWSKNGIGLHHGPLFQEPDRVELPADPDEDKSDIYRKTLRRSLGAVLPRLQLMGIRLEVVRRDYELLATEWQETQEFIVEGDSDRQPLAPLPFDQFLDFIRAHPIASLDGAEDWSIEPNARKRNEGRFHGSTLIPRIPRDNYNEPDPHSEQSYFVQIVNLLGPYATLRLLAECPDNLTLPVEWGYAPLVNSGWIDPEAVHTGTTRHQRTLVATEGSSDVHILSHALSLLRPEVADFFQFIDISQRHPFSGIGSLVNFAEGLAKIDVQNQIVFLFDNDAEGVDAAQRVRQFTLPDNMRVLVLPDLEEFRRFSTQGPDGVRTSDINGRAAAMECYLDLRRADRPPAQVQWTALKTAPDVYQGALQYKDQYTKLFLRQTAETIRDGSYDISKLERVLDVLIEECSSLAANATLVGG
jgi:hypothetical protein